MSPTPEELKLGEKAYRRVQFYEKHGVRKRRADPWIIAWSFVPLLIFTTLAVKPYLRRDALFVGALFSMAAFLWKWSQNQMTKDSYANQKMILQLLKEKYGDTLPWLVEEKQLAQARELEAKIANNLPASHA